MKSRGAIEALEERMSRDPLSRAFLQLAEEYRKVGRYDDAVRVCMEGLARHPAYHTARIALGRTYLEAGDLEGARRALSEVLELAPENHLAAKLLAEVQRRLGDKAGAAATYRAILGHYPGDREIAALLLDLEGPATPPIESAPVVKPGVAPAAASRPTPPAPRAPSTAPPARSAAPPAIADEPAFEYRQEDLESRPRPEVPHPGPEPDVLQTNTLAELYLRQGMVDKALQVYREMVRVDPGNERARLRLRDLAPGAEAPVRPSPPPPALTESRQAGVATDRPPVVVPPGPSAPGASAGENGAAAHRAAIGRLERWLRTIRTHAAAGEERAIR